jgi:hypothetical protein
MLLLLISSRAGKTFLLVLLRSMQKTSLGMALSILLAFSYCEKATFHVQMKKSCPISMAKLALACYVSWLGMSHARCSVFSCLCMPSLSCISEAQWIEPIKEYDDKRRSSCVSFG